MVLIQFHTKSPTVWQTSFASERIEYSEWSDQQLAPFIALDCETDANVDLRTSVQPLVIVSVSDGASHYLLKPNALPRFLAIHRDRSFVFWNAGFDLPVLAQAAGPVLSRVLFDALEQNRCWDAMLLEGLLRLAADDSDPFHESLDRVSRRRFGVELDKGEGSWRCRYHQLADQPLDRWPTEARDYAQLDAVTTMRIFAQQCQELASIRTQHIHPLAGPLSIFTQTRAAVALADISRRGIAVDRTCRDRSFAELRASIETFVTRLEQLIGGELFRRSKKTGEILRTPKTGIPSKNQATLIDVLSRIAASHELNIPTTANGRMSTSIKTVWRQFTDVDPIIETWIGLEEAVKLQSFFANITEDRVHPSYRVMVRTGRTSCKEPNIQQLPRSGHVRDMFIPSPGHVFLACDYSYIELVTLAAVCERMYGFSNLGRAIRQGYDPHEYTASQLAGIPIDVFRTRKGTDDYANWRQRAKAVNFGIPGGLSAQTLTAYARLTYGVDMTLEEAEHFRTTHITQTYPELSHYLAEDGYAVLAENLRTTVDIVRSQFHDDASLGFARRVLQRYTASRDGKPYNATQMAHVWLRLHAMNCNPTITIAAYAAGPELFRKLFTSSVETLTSRIRANVRFTAARNTPFQGLAADGMKEALYRLMRASYRVVACVHDEVIVELPEHGIDHKAAADDVSRIMREAMRDVIQSDLPVNCEYALMRRWYKGAKPTFDDTGRLVPWEPKPSV